MTLLRDVFSFGELQILSESNSSGPMKVRGLFQEAEKKNQNLTADASDAAQENTPLQDVAEGLTAAKLEAAAAATTAWRGLTGAENRETAAEDKQLQEIMQRSRPTRW